MRGVRGVRGVRAVRGVRDGVTRQGQGGREVAWSAVITRECGETGVGASMSCTCLDGCIVGTRVGWLVGLFTGCRDGCDDGCLDGCLDGWFVGWRDGWLVGRETGCLLGCDDGCVGESGRGERGEEKRGGEVWSEHWHRGQQQTGIVQERSLLKGCVENVRARCQPFTPLLLLLLLLLLPLLLLLLLLLLLQLQRSFECADCLNTCRAKQASYVYCWSASTVRKYQKKKIT